MVMYDFETMGQTPDTKVVSLGAVAFNKTGILGEKYWVFDLDAQEGRSEDASTAAWWKRQSEEARAVFNTPKEKQISIEKFLLAHDDWVDGLLFEENETRKELKPWGNGANFDVVILEDCYRWRHPKGKDGIPWAFWNVWCFRTFDKMTDCKSLIPKNKAGVSKVVAHNALDDARWQAQTVLAYWAKIEAKRKAGIK